MGSDVQGEAKRLKSIEIGAILAPIRKENSAGRVSATYRRNRHRISIQMTYLSAVGATEGATGRRMTGAGQQFAGQRS